MLWGFNAVRKLALSLIFFIFFGSICHADLVHRYSFTNGDSGAVDSVGGQNGTLVGDAEIISNAVQLDGNGDYVNLPSDLITGFTSVTFEFWFNYSNNGAWVRVFDFGDINASNGRYYIFFTPQSGSNTSRFVISDDDPGNSNEEIINYTLILYNTPVYIACVYDGDNDTMSIYFNGEPTGSIGVSIPLSAVDNVYSYLGKSLYNADPYLNGSIDEFRIYNNALDSDTIYTNYTLGPDLASASYIATNPNPPNNTAGVRSSTQLSWTEPINPPDGYTVYVSDSHYFIDAQIIEVSDGNACSPILNDDTTYYWRVDTHYGTSIYEGIVWNFTTCALALDRSPVGDINGDYEVDFYDLQLMANDWLADESSPANLIDVGGQEGIGVDNADYAKFASNWRRSAPKLVINELMADNKDYLQDPNGDNDDWIEIYNASSASVDLGGMYLTDNLDNPDKWRIPDGTTIEPQGYILFWADEEETEGNNHTNFQLDKDGEEVGLFDTDGSSVIDVVVFDEQYTDISYGRYPDNGQDWRFFDGPTALLCNCQGYLGVVADPEFSSKGGFYETGFDVYIGCDTPDANIYYTTDFTKPTQSSLQYTGSPIHIDPTACLRVIAVKPGWLSSRVVSRTYISLDDVTEQSASPPGFPTYWGPLVVDYEVDPDVVDDPAYSATFKDDLQAIPSVCVVIPNDDFFGAATGLYANASQRGELWEREASIEIIDPCTGEYIQANAGLRAHGGYARTQPVAKQSLRIIFRSEYGPTKLQFPLFEDSDIEVFDQLVLRATWNYSWTGDSGGNTQRAQYMRELYAHDTIRDMGRLQGYGRHVHVYVNGLYWGMYILTERPDDAFASEHLGGSKSDYDVLKTDAQYWTGENVIELLSGDLQAWDELFTLAEADLSTPEAYAAIQEYVDIPAMIDYMLMIFHTGSRDAPVLIGNDTAPRNFYAIRKRQPGSGFVFIPWDVEWSLEGESVDRVNVAAYINGYENPAYLTVLLKANKEFRMLFADHAHKHFFNDGLLTEQNTADRYWTRIMDIDRAIVGESARWGDYRRSYLPYTRDAEWVTERDRLINNYFPARRNIVLSQLRSAGLYPYLDAPVFYINGSYQHGGYISTSDLFSITATSGTIWYTLDGGDPRLPTTSQGSETTLAAEDANKSALVPDSDIGTTWRTDPNFDDSSWDLCTGSPGGVGYEAKSGYEGLISLDVTDDMYGQGKNTTCYIRIPFTVESGDLASFDYMTLKVRYDDAFVAYLNGTLVASRNFSGTPQWNSSADIDTHEASTGGWDESIDISAYLGDLNVGDNVLAIHGMNHSSTSSDFLICAELVAGSGGEGGAVSPTAIEYIGAITFGKSTQVKARAKDGSTWSALNEAVYAIGPVAENLRITEIMYHPEDTNDPNDPDKEYIELKNIGITTINLNLVSFTKGISFTFPDWTLDPDEFALVVKDYDALESQYASEPNFNTNTIAGEYTGSLDNAGEKIILEDAAGQTIHDFKYSDGWFDITDGEGFSLTIRDAENTDPNSWDSKSGWRTSAYVGGSPGWDDSADIPDRGTIVINELLAHSHAEATDWIELHNTTGETINIGGWFLSDSDSNLMKYEIAEGTTIGPYGYIVFYEEPNFGDLNDPGCLIPFALSENGETLYIHAGRDGQLMGEMDIEQFDASETGIAFGRYLKSTGTYNFVAMSENTPDSANAYPKVGPIVINEIMYHPTDTAGEAEYVELLNMSGSTVTLQEYDTEQLIYVSWRFTDSGGVTFDFPLGTTMEDGEYLLLVKNIDAFNDAGYPTVPGGVQIFEWDDGKLDNGGEKIQLSKPGDEDPATHERYYIRVDRVNYSDGSHPAGEDPWPAGPDGSGESLHRLFPQFYGNDPNNWQGAAPTPGT